MHTHITHNPTSQKKNKCQSSVRVSGDSKIHGPLRMDCVVLEEEIDPLYEPSENEVIEYAEWLGMDPHFDKDLLWIAREGLKVHNVRISFREARRTKIINKKQAPLPVNWKPCRCKNSDDIYYFNFRTGESKWEHPCDAKYREMYEKEKRRRNSNSTPTSK